MAKNTPPSSYVGVPFAVPGKPVVQTFSTPNLDDRVYVMRVDSRKPDFVLPNQGDTYSGPNSDKFTDFQFATAKPTDQVGWLDLFYVNERDNQDDYNFEVTYPYADRDYPTYTRTYVVTRDDNRALEPQADAVDPVHSDLLLIDHKWIRLQDPVLDAVFIGVQRVYQRLPSPVMTDYGLNEAQQVVTIEEQEVAANAPVPTPSATTESWKTEGPTTAKSKITVATVDEVFPETRYQLDREDRILPFKFRTRNPMETDSHIEAGTAVVPTLAPDDWSAEEHQTTEFKKFVSRSFRSSTLPITLIDYKLDNDQRLVTVTDTWDSGLQTITPSTDLVEATVNNMGNDESIQSLSTVDGPFPRGDYSVKVPDLVPEKFRAAIPIQTTALTSTGTAAMEILAIGELEHREEQQTDFWKRTTSTGRDAASLPITLLEYKLTDSKQIETVSATYDIGLQTISSVDELTTEASVENLGNSTSVLTVGTVPDLFTEARYAIRIPDAIPERFRVAVPTTTVSLLSAGTATPPTLGTGDLSISEEQVNEFVIRTSTEGRAGVTLPVSLTSYKYTRDKQIETVIETLDTGLQTITGSSTTVEATVDNLGNNTSLKTLGTVPVVFDEARYAIRIPDAIPERFRVAVPTTTTSLVAAGTAAPPTLGTGDLSISEEQTDAFNFRTTTEGRAGISLPVSLQSYKLTKDQQVETVTESLDTGLQTISGVDETYVEAAVDNLGNNTSLLTVGTVPSLFDEARYATRIPDTVPERFRVAVPTTTTSIRTAGTAAPPSLGTGDLSISEEQETEFILRTTTESRAGISLPISLQSYKYTRDKQIETVTETLDTGLQTITGSSTTVEANVDNLGNNTSLKLEGTVPVVFDEARYAIRIPDVVPERFRVAVPTTTTSLVTAGTATPPTLGVGDLSISEEQTDAFNLRTTTEGRAGISLPVSLQSYKLTKDQQVETVTETLDTGLQTISGIDETFVEASVDNLGNNTSLLTVGAVPTLFGEEKFSTRIPDTVPERFRVAVPTTTTSVRTAGTAAPPSLGTGDLSISEEQETEFILRTTTESRAGISLPISLQSYKYTRDKQIETVTETLDTGLQTISGAATTVEANVDNLGNNTSLKLEGTVPSVFDEARYATRIPDVVPERFRVAVPTTTVSTVAAGTAAPPVLGTGDLSISEEQTDAFTFRTTTEGRAGISLPVSLQSYKLTKDQQVETVLETLDTGLQTITGVDETFVEASVDNLGNNTSLKTVGAVPALFDEAHYATRIPDVVPERFRVAVPTTTTSLRTAGTATPPTLGTGDLSISEEQETEFILRTTTESRAGISLPISLQSYKYTRDKQVETVTETFDTGLQTITGSATTVEANVDNLGNNTSLKLEGTVPTVFDEARYATRIPDVVPERFRVAVPTTTVSTVAAGTAAPPVLGTGDLSISEEQTDAFTFRTTTEGRAGISLPVSLQSYKLTKDQQVETVVETLDTGLQTITGVDETFVEASVDNLGNNTSLKTIGAVPDLFEEAKYATRIPDVVPERFRVAVPTITTSLRTAGTATPPTLGTGDLSISEEQETEFILRTTTESRAGISLPISLQSYKYTRDKQVETVTETFDTGLQTITGSATTVEANVDNLGNNTSLKLEGTVPAVFDEARYATRIPDIVPERFRVAVPTTTTSIVAAGTAAPPVLGTGDLSISEEQTDAFTFRTTTEGRAGITLPVSLQSYKLTKDQQVETVTETLDTGLQTISGIDETFVEASVDNLGNNTSLKTVGAVPDLFEEAKYATRIPDVVPERFRVAVPTTTTSLRTAGTATPPTLGTGDLSISEEQETEFILRTTTESRAGISLPISLQSYKYTRDKQVETVTETFDTGLQTITGSATTVEANVDNLGNNTSLKLEGTVPEVFDEARYATRIPDVVPERFRVAVPTTTVSTVAAGTAAPPVLGTGDLSISEEQTDAFTFRTTTEGRASVSLPVSLQSYKLTRDQQVETVTETLDTGLQTITGVDETFVEASVDNLGNNTSLLTVGAVPTLFSEDKFSTRIPDVVPERFRVAVPTTTTSTRTAGTASPPSLGTGDLSISEEQETEFILRTTTESRAGISLPISLTSYKYTRDKQIETVVETFDTGLQTVTGGATTVEANVDNLGNNTSLKLVGTVPVVFDEARYATRIPDVIPERFRVAVPTTTTSVVAAGTAAPPVLGTGDLSISEEQTDAFTFRTTTEGRASVSLPVSLQSYKLTKDQQVETVTETLDTGLQTISGIDETFVEASVDNLGNNTSLKTVGAVPDLFDEARYATRIPDAVPERFRVAVPTTTTSLRTAGTATPPTLGAGDISISEEQETEFILRTTTESRAGISLPISLTSYKYTRDKQVETVVETFDTGLQTVTGSATTVEANVDNLGNNTSLKLVGSVPEVFDEAKYATRIPDVIPERFRVAVPTTTTSVVAAGTASPPVLGTGDLSISEEQTDAFTFRTTTEGRAGISLPVSLQSFKMTKEQQVETVTETLDTGLQTISGIDELTVEASVDNLGNNTSLLSIGFVDEVFDEAKYSTRIPDTIPDRFKVAVPVTTTSIRSAGTAAPPTLGTGDLSITEEQETAFIQRTTTESRAAVSLPTSLTSYKYTRDKQVETLVETLDTGLQTITGGSTTVEANVENLGNNTSLKSVGTVPSLFAETVASTEVPDLLPEIFKAVLPTHIQEISSAGTITNPPILDLGDFEKRESQIDAFNKRVYTRGRAGVSYPQTVVPLRHLGGMEFGGEVLKLDGLLDDSEMAVEEGLDVVSSEVKNLGDGSYFRQSEKLNTAVEWPILFGTETDPRTGIAVSIQKQVVAAGTAGGVTGIGSGNVLRASASVADAYVYKDWGTTDTTTEFWVTAYIAFDSAALAFWSSDAGWGGAYSGTMIATRDVSDNNIYRMYVQNLTGGPPATWTIKSASTETAAVTPLPAANVWQLVEFHVNDSASCLIELFINGSLAATSTDVSPNPFRGVKIGLGRTADNNADNVCYFKGIKVGTARYAEDLFSDDFSSGDLSAWGGSSGSVSVVSDPFGGTGISYVDVKPLDKWRSVQIASRIDLSSLPSDRTWETSVEHRFPHVLEGATWLWASATAPFNYAFDMSLVYDMKEGYAGPCRAKITESFSNGPPGDTISVTAFFPQGHTVGYAWAFAADLADCDGCVGIATAKSQTWQIPPSLHEEISIAGGVTLSGGSFSDTLPATDPVNLPPPGTLIVKACDVEPWRFGIFYRRLTEIYVPG